MFGYLIKVVMLKKIIKYFNMPVNLYVLRHGQTFGNVDNLIIGNRDSELTDLGKKQARDTAETLNNIFNMENLSADAIISSPISRAINTAKIIADKFNYDINDIEVLEGLDEFDTGAFSLKSREEAKNNKNLGDFDKLVKNREYRCPESNESIKDCGIRFDNCLKNICRHLEDNNKKNAIVVAHSFVMEQLLILKNAKNKSPFKNCEIMKISYDKNKRDISIEGRIV